MLIYVVINRSRFGYTLVLTTADKDEAEKIKNMCDNGQIIITRLGSTTSAELN